MGDKLPTMYDAATSIYNISAAHKSERRDSAINTFMLSLRQMWAKAFGEEHVIGEKYIKKRLKEILKSFHNKVYIKSHRTNVKKNTRQHQEGSRTLRLQWKSMQITVKKHSKKSGIMPTYGSLLDIGKDMATVTGRELTVL